MPYRCENREGFLDGKGVGFTEPLIPNGTFSKEERPFSQGVKRRGSKGAPGIGIGDAEGSGTGEPLFR